MDNITDNLTNEKIGRRFDNQFDLVNYAIMLAAEMIQSGRAPRVEIDTENPALQILEEIAEGKDTLEERVETEEVFASFEEKVSEEAFSKS